MPEEQVITDKVLTLVAHKLRTPLSIINGYSEAVLSQAKKENFSPFTSKALGEIHKQGARMAMLVDKLLAFNQVFTTEPGTLDKKPVDLKPLIKTCAEQAIAYENTEEAPTGSGVKRGTFVDIDCPAHISLLADAALLKLCLLELLDNAIKFNPKLEKIIKVQVAHHGNSISLAVRDYGAGIRPQDVSKIFEPFYQVDDYFTGQVSGWGLGLPLVQRVLDLHGGSISVVSDRGLGSIFTLSFPL